MKNENQNEWNFLKLRTGYRTYRLRVRNMGLEIILDRSLFVVQFVCKSWIHELLKYSHILPSATMKSIEGSRIAGTLETDALKKQIGDFDQKKLLLSDQSEEVVKLTKEFVNLTNS